MILQLYAFEIRREDWSCLKATLKAVEVCGLEIQEAWVGPREDFYGEMGRVLQPVQVKGSAHQRLLYVFGLDDCDLRSSRGA
jgi:hypothetical protein